MKRLASSSLFSARSMFDLLRRFVRKGDTTDGFRSFPGRLRSDHVDGHEEGVHRRQGLRQGESSSLLATLGVFL